LRLLALLKTALWLAKQPAAPKPSSGRCPIVLVLGAMHPALDMLRHLRDFAFRETEVGTRFIDVVMRAIG